jgi:hypothetical protein
MITILFEDQPRYYVNMLIIPTITNHTYKKHGWEFGATFITGSYIVQKSWKLNSSGISRRPSWFVVIATSICNKDQWKKTIGKLFSITKMVVSFYCATLHPSQVD